MPVHMLGSALVVLFVSPMVLFGAIPLGFVYLRVQRLYVAANRELKRLDSLAFSPIFSHLSESLQVAFTSCTTCPRTYCCSQLLCLGPAPLEVSAEYRLFVAFRCTRHETNGFCVRLKLKMMVWLQR